MRITLLAATIMLMTPPAIAQQTPGQYCASLAASSCEVLNVEANSVQVQAAYVEHRYYVKACLNRKLVFRTYYIEFNGRLRGFTNRDLNGTVAFDGINLPSTGSTPVGAIGQAQDFAKFCDAPW